MVGLMVKCWMMSRDTQTVGGYDSQMQSCVKYLTSKYQNHYQYQLSKYQYKYQYRVNSQH